MAGERSKAAAFKPKAVASGSVRETIYRIPTQLYWPVKYFRLTSI